MLRRCTFLFQLGIFLFITRIKRDLNLITDRTNKTCLLQRNIAYINKSLRNFFTLKRHFLPLSFRQSIIWHISTPPLKTYLCTSQLCYVINARHSEDWTQWDFALPHEFILKSQRCFQLHYVRSQEQKINKSKVFKQLFSDARSLEIRHKPWIPTIKTLIPLEIVITTLLRFRPRNREKKWLILKQHYLQQLPNYDAISLRT